MGSKMIDFLKYRPFYIALSAAIFITCIGAYVHKYYTRGYAFIYSVEYTGGTQVLLGFSKPVHSEAIVKILDKQGIKGAVARDFSDKEILVRVAEYSNDAKGLAERIKETVQASMPDNTIEIKAVDQVGSGMGSELWKKSLMAIVLGLLLMLMYTWWRFWSLAFGVGVLVSLFHDAIVILGFFLLFDYEISANVIAAILAVLGYSINDTIVIFARIRENIGKLRDRSMEDIVNISTNETLRRTLLTSFATCLVVVALLLFGGHSLRALSLALLVGITFGTYSSIAIASPVMLSLYREKKR
jgi:preprotein translocase subunit SecF